MSQFKIPNEPSGMEIAQREADEAAGDADPRERVWGASPPDWLTAQAKAIGTARAKKPKSAYQRRWPR